MINPIYNSKKSIEDLKKKLLGEQKGVKHIVLDNFLEENYYINLQTEIQASKGKVTGNRDGRQIIYYSGINSKKFENFYLKILPEFISQIYGVKIQMEYQKGGNNIIPGCLIPYIYKKGFFYRRNLPGSLLEWHTDGPENKIAGSFILYLNDSWKKGDGGELELGKKIKNSIIPYSSIEPFGNRIVLLKCEHGNSRHRVLKSFKSRYFIHDQLIKKS